MHQFYSRYIRHIVLSDIGILGQDALLNSKVLCVGAGGLGSIALTYLASTGVGTIGIVDFDTVDISNLNRQIIYNIFDLGKHKIFSAFNFLKKLNNNIFINTYKDKLSKSNYLDILSGYDIILDCTDTLESKFYVNDFSMLLNIPIIHGSVFGLNGYVSMFSREYGCYRCIYDYFPYSNCIGHGILGPIAGVVGAIQAIETIKFLLNKFNNTKFDNLFSNILIIDFKKINFFKIQFNKKLNCSSCS